MGIRVAILRRFHRRCPLRQFTGKAGLSQATAAVRIHTIACLSPLTSAHSAPLRSLEASDLPMAGSGFDRSGLGQSKNGRPNRTMYCDRTFNRRFHSNLEDPELPIKYEWTQLLSVRFMFSSLRRHHSHQARRSAVAIRKCANHNLPVMQMLGNLVGRG